MKNIFSLVVISFLLFSCASIGDFFNGKKLHSSGEFVLGTEDIPLTQGMKRIFEESLGFDSHSGSILSSSYKVKSSKRKIRKFYVSTLPQLGWEIVEGHGHQLSFVRENEKLEMDLISKGEFVIVEFLSSSSLH